MSIATLPPAALPATPVTTPTSGVPGPTLRRRPPAPTRVKLGPVGHRAPVDRARVETAPHRLRLTRRGRALSSLTALAAMALIGFGLVQAAAPAAPPVLTQRTVTVLPGQSAWELAQAVNPSVDPRVTLTAVERLNGLESAGLVQPGQQLRVPVYAAS